MTEIIEFPQLYSPVFRMVDLNVVAHNLWCQSCNFALTLKNCVQDKFNEYRSVLEIRCPGCLNVKPVSLTLLDSNGGFKSYKNMIEKRQSPWKLHTKGFADVEPQVIKSDTFRLVDLNLLAHILWCQNCKQALSLRDCIQDRFNTFRSVLEIKCHGCLHMKSVNLTMLSSDGSNNSYKKLMEKRRKAWKSDHLKLTKTCQYANIQLKKLETLVTEDVCDTTDAEETRSALSNDDGDSDCVIIEDKCETLVAPLKTLLHQKTEYKENFSTSEDSNDNDSDVSEYEPPDSDEDSSEDDSDDSNIVENSRNSMKENKSPGCTEKCLYCPEEFPSYKKTTCHMKKQHPEFLKLKCGECQMQFKAFKSFKYHIKGHRSSLHRICPYCGKVSKTESHLLRHLEGLEGADVKCPKCPAVLKPSSMKKHILLHNTPLSCDFCGKKFSKKSRLIEHIWLHVNNESYKCKICGAKFLQRDNRNTHMKNNHNWVCLLCNLNFKKAEDAEKHTNEHCKEELEAWKLDNGTKPFEKVTRFQCEHCFRYLASKQSLQFHVARIRTENSKNRPGEQNVHKRKSSTNNNKKKQAKSSTSEKITRFQCAHCSKYLASKQSLKAHMTRLHLRLQK